MSVEKFDFDDNESLDKMRDRMQAMFSPIQVDQSLRQAIGMCWMALPGEKRNIDELERQVRFMVDRAFKDMREDAKTFWGKLYP